MAPAPTVGLGTLRRLSELSTERHPVLTVYLGIDPLSSSPRADWERQLETLLAGLMPATNERDGERVRQMLRAMPEPAYGTRGLGLFSSANGSVFTTVWLPEPVEAMAVFDAIPWIEPLADLCAPGSWGVAVLSAHRTRLLRGGPRTLVEFAGTGPQPVGWVCGLLLRAHRRRPFERLAIATDDQRAQTFETVLDGELRGRLAEIAALDLDEAPTQQIGRAVRSLMRGNGTPRPGVAHPTSALTPDTPASQRRMTLSPIHARSLRCPT